MTERIINDPSQHGWVLENGKWVWGASGGSGGGGSIADGDTEGQITTWSGTEWTPEGGVVVDASGNVGIGRSAPNGYSDRLRNLVVASPSNTGITIAGGPSSRTSIQFTEEGAADIAHGLIDYYNDQNKMALVTAGQEQIIIGADGRVDITGSLYVNGSEVGSGGAYVPLTGNSTVNGTITATDFIATSDERLKEDITTAPSDVVSKLRGVEFTWKDSGDKSSGVIAQELEAAGLNHLVHDDGESKSVAYNGLVAYLIEEVKALRAEVESLK